MSVPYTLIKTSKPEIPIIVSVPHCGTSFPEDIQEHYHQDLLDAPDDTDWFVDKLYRFVSDMGITMIFAKYNRWVIDLNRDPANIPLYQDGRVVTGLTPITDFCGRDLYKSSDFLPSRMEIKRRLNLYYWPYYKEIQRQLDRLLRIFGHVLLWDAHSIRQFVPLIQKERFPDLILSDNMGAAADIRLIETALDTLRSGPFQVRHNQPFIGGHVTRYFGQSCKQVHALQLEMNKVLYMDDAELTFHSERAGIVEQLLRKTLVALSSQLISKALDN